MLLKLENISKTWHGLKKTFLKTQNFWSEIIEIIHFIHLAIYMELTEVSFLHNN